jgi:cell wall-associated NlpC family hydrolase
MIPRPGDYIVVRTHGVIATLSCWITRSRFNHAAIVIENGQVIEAEPGGVRIRPLSEYDGHLMLANTAEPTLAEERAQVVEFARSAIARPYAYAADLVDGLEHLGLRWRFLGRFTEGRRAVMCSMLVADAGDAAGLTGWQCGKASAAEVVPGDLAARIEKGRWR